MLAEAAVKSSKMEQLAIYHQHIRVCSNNSALDNNQFYSPVFYRLNYRHKLRTGMAIERLLDEYHILAQKKSEKTLSHLTHVTEVENQNSNRDNKVTGIRRSINFMKARGGSFYRTLSTNRQHI